MTDTTTYKNTITPDFSGNYRNRPEAIDRISEFLIWMEDNIIQDVEDFLDTAESYDDVDPAVYKKAFRKSKFFKKLEKNLEEVYKEI